MSDKILIRYNTNREQGSQLYWRVFINGVEYLASGFEVFGTMYSATSEENGICKHNVGCIGTVEWYNDTYAKITTT